MSANRWKPAWMAVLAWIVLMAAMGDPRWGWGAPKGNGPKKGKVDTSGEFFSNAPIPRITIEITETNLAQLRQNNRSYVRATVREGEMVYKDVGIHLKGAAGSFRGIDDRPALTLNFDKFKDNQKFHGLDKIHLNNSVQDPSYMTEALCGEMFLAAGVPAARTTHARVKLNGRDLGLYVLKEGFDKTFLRRHFQDANGNLYDGGFLREITDSLQRNSGDGDVTGHADLKALANAAQEADPVKRMERLEKVLDVDRFITFIALEIMTWHWDGYAKKRNNYRVYHDPTTDKLVFFPHGMDQMFWVPDGSLRPTDWEGLVARAVLQTGEGRQRYRERIATLLTNVFRLEVLTNRMHQIQARIRPELAAIHPGAAQNHDGAVQHLRHQIVQRALSLERLLNEPEPKPLPFDASGMAVLSAAAWRVQDPSGTAVLDKVTGADNKPALHIRIGNGGQPIASWRTRVLLPGGQYRLAGQVRTTGVVPVRDQKGEGAGLRISGSKQPRPNNVSGDSPWQKVEYEFDVPADSDEVELVCELRAVKGEAWFDVESLRLFQKAK